MKWDKRIQWVFWGTAVLLVVAALPYWPEGFLLFLRIVVCAVSLLAIHAFRDAPRSRWITLLVVLAAFNPVFPPPLPAMLWAGLDVVAAYLFWSLGAELSARAEGSAESSADGGEHPPADR